MSANKITILDETDKTELEQNKANADLSNVNQNNILDKIGVLQVANGGTGATTVEEIAQVLSGNLVPFSGGTMTGLLNVLAPVGDSNATTKKYVDDKLTIKADLISGKVPKSQLPEMDCAKTDLSNVNLTLKFEKTSVPTSVYWRSIAYGNGVFIAVASGTNLCAHSTDGINWEISSSTTDSSTEWGPLPHSADWYSVCYGGGKFMAVAGQRKNYAAYSTDGKVWHATNPLPSGNWQSVCYGNGKFVAVAAYSSVAAYSANGTGWISTTMPSTNGGLSVCYGNGMFVAVTVDGEAAYSTDGINWTQSTMPSDTQWDSVCYGNGKFVAVAGNSNECKSAYSIDGINWTKSNLPLTQSWGEVTYGNGKFIAITSSFSANKAAYSTDGINWAEVTLPSSGYWSTVAYGNGIFVAGKSGTTFAYGLIAPTITNKLADIGMARIQVASYVGTGTYGNGNETTISVDFPPKLLIIAIKDMTRRTIYISNLESGTGLYLSADGSSSIYGAAEVKVSYVNGKVYMYSYSNEYAQMNINGSTYVAVAIG